MKVEYVVEDNGQRYWYAATDQGGFDADGPTPIDAISALCRALEVEVDEAAS